MGQKKLKFDKEEIRKTCYFAIENEKRKGNTPINKDGSKLTKEQYFQESLELLDNPSFIADIEKILKRGRE